MPFDPSQPFDIVGDAPPLNPAQSAMVAPSPQAQAQPGVGQPPQMPPAAPPQQPQPAGIPGFNMKLGPTGVTLEQQQPGQSMRDYEFYKKENPGATYPDFLTTKTMSEKLGEGYATSAATMDKGREDAAELNGQLSNMQMALRGFNPGKGSTSYYNAAAWLNSFLPGFVPLDSMAPDKVASYQEFTKLATKYSTTQARQLGAREAASVVNIMINANPNADLMESSMQRIIGGLSAQNDYTIAKANAKDDWIAQHKTMAGFDKEWISSNPPEKFLQPYLKPDDWKNIPPTIMKKIYGDIPPLSALKPGVVREFGNGQKWTVVNGEQVRVQ